MHTKLHGSGLFSFTMISANSLGRVSRYLKRSIRQCLHFVVLLLLPFDGYDSLEYFSRIKSKQKCTVYEYSCKHKQVGLWQEQIPINLLNCSSYMERHHSTSWFTIYLYLYYHSVWEICCILFKVGTLYSLPGSDHLSDIKRALRCIVKFENDVTWIIFS